MSQQSFRIDDPTSLRRAGATDLIELRPAPGSHPQYVQKRTLEVIGSAFLRRESLHMSGPTGTGKTSLVEALWLVPENWRGVCRILGADDLPLWIHPVEMATFESPAELFQRRALRDGATFDEPSVLVLALRKAVESKEKFCNVIWLREIGRVHSASVQGGLLNLMTRGSIVLPDGARLEGQGIGWLADSNYQAEGDATHTLVTFDDALKRRFRIELTLDYPTAEHEAEIATRVCLSEARSGRLSPHDVGATIQTAVKLGGAIRRARAKGELMSAPPPSVFGYVAFAHLVQSLPHMSLADVAMFTLLGNVTADDRPAAVTVLGEIFGQQVQDAAADPTTGAGLI